MVLLVCTNYEHEHVSTKGHVIVSRSVQSDPSDGPSPTLHVPPPNEATSTSPEKRVQRHTEINVKNNLKKMKSVTVEPNLEH